MSEAALAAIDDPAQNREASLEYALELRKCGRLTESILVLNRLLILSDVQPLAFLWQGLNYMNTGRLVVAIGYFNKYLSYYPNDAETLGLVGFCVLKYTCYEESIPYLRKAIQYGAQDVNLLAYLGEALFRSGKYSESLKCFQECHSRGGVSDKKRVYDFMFRSIEILYQGNPRQASGTTDCCAEIVKDLKSALCVTNIICLGDSHALLFEYVNGLDVFQTGSPTAYNLISENSSSKSLKTIMTLLDQYEPNNTAVMLTYAEIDIRNHIYKQMIARQMNLVEACEIVVERYGSVISQIDELGYKVLINGPFGSGFGVPRVGSEHVRNCIATTINTLLSDLCSEKDWIYHSLSDVLIDNEYNINKAYFGEVDDNHLNKSQELCFFLLASFLQHVRRLYPRSPLAGTSDPCAVPCLFSRTPYHRFYPSSISYIRQSVVLPVSQAFAKYNQALISFNDHVLLTGMSFSFTDVIFSEYDVCEVTLLDSQFVTLNKLVTKPMSNLLLNCDFDPTWTWYVMIAVSACLRPSSFKTFTFMTAC